MNYISNGKVMIIPLTVELGCFELNNLIELY